MPISSLTDDRWINIKYLKNIDIDPSKVTFFRFTLPSDSPKPEYYWTSDYNEKVKGLDSEIPPDQRENGIILVAYLETISKNNGLIQDINDDRGLPVRQIGTSAFDQRKVIARFNPIITFMI